MNTFPRRQDPISAAVDWLAVTSDIAATEHLTRLALTAALPAALAMAATMQPGPEADLLNASVQLGYAVLECPPGDPMITCAIALYQVARQTAAGQQ